MNKERLEKFINETLNAPYFSTLYDRDMWEKDKQELIRDLEILEILLASFLKKPLSHGTDPDKSILLDSQSFDRIKELLKNEK